jgi:hypothetical protein
MKKSAGPAGEIPSLRKVLRVVAVGVRKIGDGEEDFLRNGAREDLVTGTREFPALGTVTLDEGVKQADADAPDDALNPARYVLTRVSALAFEASVIGVEPVTSSAVDLLTNSPTSSCPRMSRPRT